MDGIYLTEECKKKIENKIYELEKEFNTEDDVNYYSSNETDAWCFGRRNGKIELLEEILNPATIITIQQ